MAETDYFLSIGNGSDILAANFTLEENVSILSLLAKDQVYGRAQCEAKYPLDWLHPAFRDLPYTDRGKSLLDLCLR